MLLFLQSSLQFMMFPVSSPSKSEWLSSNGLLSWRFPKALGSYTLIGRSRAADATSFVIPELDMLLDCGCLVSNARPSHIFITHAHADHCLSITRLLSQTRPPHVYLPSSAVVPMREFIEKFRILNATEPFNPDPSTWIPNHQLIGVQPDQMLSLNRGMQVRVFEMDHSVPCCGYGFYETRKKLKKEYGHLTGKEIVALRQADPSLQISEERLAPQFAFLGDTTASIFERYQEELLRFPLIIVECSFIDHEQHGQRAADVKHVVWVRMISVDFRYLTSLHIVDGSPALRSSTS